MSEQPTVRIDLPPDVLVDNLDRVRLTVAWIAPGDYDTITAIGRVVAPYRPTEWRISTAMFSKRLRVRFRVLANDVNMVRELLAEHLEIFPLRAAS